MSALTLVDLPSIMLDTQYRMHPQISAFSNQSFYGGALHDGTVGPDGQVVPGFEPPVTDYLTQRTDGTRNNMSFIDCDAPEQPRNLSVANEREAELVCDVVMDLLAHNPVSWGMALLAAVLGSCYATIDYISADTS